MPSSTADRAPPFNLLICDDRSAGFRRLVNDQVVSLERMLTTSPKEGWVLPDHSILAMALLCRRSGTPIIRLCHPSWKGACCCSWQGSDCVRFDLLGVKFAPLLN